MSTTWIEIREDGSKRRAALRSGRTRVGGTGSDLVLADPGEGELHFWDQPPRVVYVGGGEGFAHNGRRVREASLAPGDRIEWGAGVVVYEGERLAALEELPIDSREAGSATTGEGGAPADGGHGRDERDEDEERLFERLLTGLAFDQELVHPKVARRWRQAVLADEFDPDACAQDVLARCPLDFSDPRLMQRAGRLERDFVAAALTQGARGASLRARRAAKGGVAFVIAQGLALLVFALIVLAALLLLRMRDSSVDAWLDGILSR